MARERAFHLSVRLTQGEDERLRRLIGQDKSRSEVVRRLVQVAADDTQFEKDKKEQEHEQKH